MFDNGLGWLWLIAGLGVAYILFIIWLPKWRERHRPVVCVCRVNDRVGVVLRKDHNRGSRMEWAPYMKGEEHYDRIAEARCLGRILVVPNVFTFRGGPELDTLLYGCYVEEAIFSVPRLDGGTTPKRMLENAHEHFHGKPWDGSFVHF